MFKKLAESRKAIVWFLFQPVALLFVIAAMKEDWNKVAFWTTTIDGIVSGALILGQSFIDSVEKVATAWVQRNKA